MSRSKVIHKEERFSRVPRLLDICYSAKGTQGYGDMQAAKRKGPKGKRVSRSETEMRHLPAVYRFKLCGR